MIDVVIVGMGLTISHYRVAVSIVLKKIVMNSYGLTDIKPGATIVSICLAAYLKDLRSVSKVKLSLCFIKMIPRNGNICTPAIDRD